MGGIDVGEIVHFAPGVRGLAFRVEQNFLLRVITFTSNTTVKRGERVYASGEVLLIPDLSQATFDHTFHADGSVTYSLYNVAGETILLDRAEKNPVHYQPTEKIVAKRYLVPQKVEGVPLKPRKVRSDLDKKREQPRETAQKKDSDSTASKTDNGTDKAGTQSTTIGSKPKPPGSSNRHFSTSTRNLSRRKGEVGKKSSSSLRDKQGKPFEATRPESAGQTVRPSEPTQTKALNPRSRVSSQTRPALRKGRSLRPKENRRSSTGSTGVQPKGPAQSSVRRYSPEKFGLSNAKANQSNRATPFRKFQPKRGVQRGGKSKP